MINTEMRTYDFYSYTTANGYGESTLSSEPTGTILMAINTTAVAVQDNINYKDASYIGLTHGIITDNDAIDYEGSLLKVLYVNPKGRYKQVFLKRVK